MGWRGISKACKQRYCVSAPISVPSPRYTGPETTEMRELRERSTTDKPVLLHEHAGGVVTLTLNRPEQFNALSQELLTELETALADIAEDETARVLVIAGAGKAYSDRRLFARDAKNAYQRVRASLED